MSLEGRGRSVSCAERARSPPKAEGDAGLPALTERLVLIARELGEGQLEVDAENATGDVLMARFWEW